MHYFGRSPQEVQTKRGLLSLNLRFPRLPSNLCPLCNFQTFNSDEVVFGRSKDEIFRALQEREQFKQDLDSMQEALKREQRKAKVTQDDLREKVRSLEAELSKQHEETVKNFQMMKEVWFYCHFRGTVSRY